MGIYLRRKRIFVDPVSTKVLENLPKSALNIFGVGFIVTVASLATCIPLVFMFNKFVPQLVGKPKIRRAAFEKLDLNMRDEID